MAESQYGYISDKTRYLDRLRRIEGQARGIHRMIEEEQYCIDILTQIGALTAARVDIRVTLVGTG
jgi:DNA-binding FrmR family transcriptional regulator